MELIQEFCPEDRGRRSHRSASIKQTTKDRSRSMGKLCCSVFRV